jgi:cell pole-organizing protein PopZ
MAEALKSQNLRGTDPSQDIMDEPSMEDILASIREIIEEDERAKQVEDDRSLFQHPAEGSNVNTTASEEDLVEQLTQQLEAPDQAELSAAVAENGFDELVFEDPTAAPRPVAKPAPAPEAESVRHFSVGRSNPFRLPGNAPEAAEEAPVSAAVTPELNTHSDVVEPNEAKPTASPPAIKRTIPASPAPSTVPELDEAQIASDVAARWLEGNGKDMRTLVEETAVPLIRRWMAENLNDMVERLIREEIEAASRRNAQA